MLENLKKTIGVSEGVICVFLALFATVIYLDTLRAGFVADDKGLIVDNEIIHSVENVPQYFVRPFSIDGMDERSTAYYRPVIATSFAMDYALGDGEPWVFHLHNIIAFGICVVLVYLLLREMLPTRMPAVIGALIFAAHPIHTETVCWIAGRTDLYALLFMLAAVLCGLKARGKKGSQWWLVGTLVCAALAMFSKEIALILLPVWITYELTCGRREQEESGWYAGVYVSGIFGILTAAYLGARALAVGGLETSAGAPLFNPWTLPGMATIGRCVLEYMRRLILPHNLSFAFEIDPFTSPLSWRAVGYITGGLGLFGVTVYATWRRFQVAFWLWWMWLGLGPVLNIIPINEMVAERFLFVPSVGYSCLLGLGFASVLRGEWASGKWVRRATYAALVVLVCGLGAQTVMRSFDWRSERRLYLSALRSHPYRPWARVLAGEVYLSNPRVPERAYLHYSRALELAEHRVGLRFVAHNALGKLCGELKKPYEALVHFQRALELRPDSAMVRTNMGMQLIQTGENKDDAGMLREGREELEKAIDSEPDYPEAYFVLGYWQMTHGDDPSGAIELFDRAANLDSSFAAPREYKARVLLQQGRLRQALREARQALTIRDSKSAASLVETIQKRMDDAGSPDISDDTE